MGPSESADALVLVVGGTFGGLALGGALMHGEALPEHPLGTPFVLLAFAALGGVIGFLAGRRP